MRDRNFWVKVIILEGICSEISVCFEGEIVWDFILIGEIEEADRPLAVAVETVDNVTLDLFCRLRVA